MTQTNAECHTCNDTGFIIEKSSKKSIKRYVLASVVLTMPVLAFKGFGSTSGMIFDIVILGSVAALTVIITTKFLTKRIACPACKGR